MLEILPVTWILTFMTAVKVKLSDCQSDVEDMFRLKLCRKYV